MEIITGLIRYKPDCNYIIDKLLQIETKDYVHLPRLNRNLPESYFDEPKPDGESELRKPEKRTVYGSDRNKPFDLCGHGAINKPSGRKSGGNNIKRKAA